jgi:predicted PurR-regulated permease PerM
MQFTPTQKHVAAWLLIALLAVLALWLLGRVLTPFVVAAVLAYALTPLVDRLDELGRGRMPRFVAVAIVELLLILVLVSLVLIVVPVLAKEVPLIREQLPFLFDKLNTSITPVAGQLGISLPLDLASIKAQLVKYLSANFEEAISSVFSSLRVGGGVALIVVGYAVLVPVALFYLLLDWKQVVERALELVPAASPRQRGLVHHGSRPGAGAIPARAAARDGDHGYFLQHGPGLVRAGPGRAYRRLHRPGHVRALRGLRHWPGASRCGRHTASSLPSRHW